MTKPLYIGNGRSEAIRRRHLRALRARAKHCPSLVSELFRLIEVEQISVTDLAERSGIRRCTITGWAVRATPMLEHFEATLNALGYRLKIVPIEAEKERAA